MPQRNGNRSNAGRSAVARKVLFGGPSKVNGIQPSVFVKTMTGQIIKTSYFGGPKKGGSAPSATGFNRPFGMRSVPMPGKAFPSSRPNFLFKFSTNPGPSPFGHGPHA